MSTMSFLKCINCQSLLATQPCTSKRVDQQRAAESKSAEIHKQVVFDFGWIILCTCLPADLRERRELSVSSSNNPVDRDNHGVLMRQGRRLYLLTVQ